MATFWGGTARKLAHDPGVFLPPEYVTGAVVCYEKDETIYSQGDRADSAMHVRAGAVKLTVVSKQGKEAIVALLGAGDYFGEGCITGQRLRNATATAISPTSILTLGKKEIVHLLHTNQRFSDHFISYLISHIFKVEEDLVDQLFNSTEKRLARALLLLARFGKEGRPETVVPAISQEALAEMIGTTRSRVNIFMTKFRKMGLIDYDDAALRVRNSLLDVVLHD
ncbi:MAG TPA: Crp/Fnr family transcriptional regulator [Candidatus Acidoferrales bacterium]|nr:Crp/Fnr family transcriptional regulator [Candidatus Acidoferrales bacterium]